MKKREIIMIKKLVFIIILFPACLLYAENFTNGELVYFDGEITLQRNNEIYTEDDIEIGSEIEEYDLISTGEDGYAEIMIESSVSKKIIIKVEPDSNMYFSVKKQGASDSFNLKLLSGNIFAKVDKLIGNGKMEITSKSAVMGIRGTELNITSAPEGSLLVTCPEGEVSCKFGESEVTAGNGTAAELLYGQPAKSKTVLNEYINEFKTEWASERERIFKSMAFSIIKPSAIQYEELLVRFDNLYKELKKHKKIFDKYKESGRSVSSSETIRDKISVSPSVINMRAVFFRFEQMFYRVEELHRYYKEDPVKGKIRRKYEVSDFMKNYEKNYSKTSKKIAYTRYAFKHVTLMDAAGPGQNSLMNEIFNTNPLAE